MTLWGVDVSSHNPVYDWAALKRAGISFIAIKRTGGTQYVNPVGAAQVAAARAAGVLVIHYHYFGEVGMTTGRGTDEAAHFIRTVGDDILPGEGISLDWEEHSLASIPEGLAALRALEARYGFPASVYTYPSYVSEHGFASAPELAHYPLWLASYQDAYPRTPAPWESIMAWQYSDNEDIPGVGHVDGDRFEGTIEELRAYGYRGVGALTKEAQVKEPDEGEFTAYLNAQGQTIFVANFGGQATKVDGFMVADVGVSVENAAGEMYDRSIQQNVLQGWTQRPKA